MGVLILLLLMIDAAFAVGAAIGRALGNGRSERATLLWALAVAIRLRLPIDEEIRALKPMFRRRRRKLLDRLADRIAEGMDLSTALEATPRLVTPETRMAIRTGEATGLIAETIQQQARRATQSELLRHPMIESVQGTLLYLAGLALVSVSIVSFIVTSIIPKFRKIFEDFGVRLPDATLFVVRISDLALPYVWIAFLLGFFVIPTIVWIAWVRRGGFRSLDLPFLEARLVRLDVPPILRMLSLQAEHERPLETALEAIAAEHLRRSTGRRVDRAHQLLQGGATCWAALAEAGLVTADEAEALAAAAGAGNLPWALSEIADLIDRRTARRLRLLSEFLTPAIVVPMGLIVLALAVAFFSPLVTLISEVGAVE